MSDQQYVPDEERDAILDRLLQVPENKVCFDCKSKNPKWASSSIGIFLCYQCTSLHRNLGVHISFVRSLKMDRWKIKEVKQMELGGNKAAQQYYEKNGMYVDGKPNHKAPQLAKYKSDLLKKVEQAIGIAVQSQGSAVFSIADKKEQLVDPFAVDKPFGSENLFESKAALGGLTSTGLSKNEEIKQAATFKPKTVSLGGGGLVQTQDSATFGIGTLSLKQPAEVKTLNAKKLDVNFDNDDFFNSFEPTSQAQKQSVSVGGGNATSKFVTKLQEVDDQFDVAPKQQNGQQHQSFTQGKTFSFGGSGGGLGSAPQDDYEAQQRLKSLGNKKGISSEDIFGRQEQKSEEVVQRYQQLQGAKAISSDMFFGNGAGGRPSNSNSNKDFGDEVEGYFLGRSSMNSNNSYDEYKEQAAKIAEKVTENAKILKDKALDWLSTFTTQS